MATSAISAKPTVLVWNYQKLAELLGISGPSMKVDTIDVTSHDSPDAFREFKAGLADAGEVTLEGNFIAGDTDGQVAFKTDMQGRTKRNAFIVLPVSTNAAWSFAAVATAMDQNYPHEDKLGFSASMKITGKPTLLTSGSTGISAMVGIEENEEAALSILPEIAADTYAYTCTVNTASTWVKLTVTATDHSLWIDGSSESSGVQTDEIALGAAGTDTKILIIVQETGKTPRLYTLTVTRPAA